MLDFLGLKYEAELVVLFCVLGGMLAGMGFGLISVNGKGWRDKLWTVLAWVLLGLAIVAGGLACVAGFMLLITFKWGHLFKALLIGGAVGGLLYLIFRGIFENIRLNKYRRNPLMKEIVAYCKKNDVVGIQCYADRVRFFSALENGAYCEDERKVVHLEYAKNAAATEQEDLRPETWKDYDNPPSLLKVLKFADRDYPDLPDVEIFARALAASLGGSKVARHCTAVNYRYTRFNGSTGNRDMVSHTTYTYEDWFVYKKRALKEIKKGKKQRDREAEALRVAAQKNANRWE